MRLFWLVLTVAVLLLCLAHAKKKTKDGQAKQAAGPRCCRCVQEKVGCATKSPGIKPKGAPNPPKGPKKKKPVEPGLNCDEQLECEIFDKPDCPSDPGCVLNGTRFTNLADLVDLRGSEETCIFDQVPCCDPVDAGLLINQIGPGSGATRSVDFKAVCDGDEVSAIEDFKVGRVCGKRDSRAYKHVDLPESFTNPGEWPWVVLIYGPKGYLGAGTLVAKDTVVTVAHKVKNLTAADLTVRLGDWNPNKIDEQEKFPYVELKVDCIRIHPQAVPETLENNVAVLRLALKEDSPPSILNVVTLYSADRFETGEELDEEVAEELTKQEEEEDESEFSVRALGDEKDGKGPSYINNVCLPEGPTQFADYKDRCWVAAWGQKLERQREVDLPLLGAAECQAKLQPVFTAKGVPNWQLKKSEVCAGGEPGKDACLGEGGAPLVCLDKSRNQFFAVGLVNFGFGCNSSLPAVYTNLQDPVVKDFVTKAMGNAKLCG